MCMHIQTKVQHPKSNTRLLPSFSLLSEDGVQNENKTAMMMNLLRRKCWGHKIFHPNAFSKETGLTAKQPSKERQSEKKKGLRVSRSKGFKSQGCFGISKNA